jgi:hypothetical protein
VIVIVHASKIWSAEELGQLVTEDSIVLLGIELNLGWPDEQLDGQGRARNDC